MPKIQLTGETYTGRSLTQNAQECINWYYETDSTGKHPFVLYPTPGQILFSDVINGPIRGMRVFNGALYVVGGAGLYSVNVGGGKALIGTLNTSTGYVSMSNNIDQLIVLDGQRGYVYVPSTNTFSTIASTALGLYDNFPAGATQVRFLDGYFLVNDPSNPGRFFRSESYDGTKWKALSFATAERDPDGLVALEVSHRYLYLLGEKVSEIWYNEGSDINNPIIPVPGMTMEIGCAAAFSVAKINKSILWLAADERGHGQVVISTGSNWKRVSNYAIEAAIEKYSVLSDAIGHTYQQAGHEFYVLTFPTADITWVYDITENKWHRRQSYGYGRHNTQGAVYFNKKIITGSSIDGKLFELSLEAYDDNGVNIPRQRTTQHIGDSEEDSELFFACLKLDVESGVGNNETPEPLIGLSWSKDGGKTFGNTIYRSLGSVGNYKKEIFFRDLGRSKTRTFKISIAEKVKCVLLGGFVEVHSGNKSARSNPVG